MAANIDAITEHERHARYKLKQPVFGDGQAIINSEHDFRLEHMLIGLGNRHILSTDNPLTHRNHYARSLKNTAFMFKIISDDHLHGNLMSIKQFRPIDHRKIFKQPSGLNGTNLHIQTHISFRKCLPKKQKSRATK